VIELAFRGRVSMQKDSSRRRFPLADRVIEVIDDTLTGEVLLDEALKMMKASEKMSVSSWIDLMSGKAASMFKYSCKKQFLNVVLQGRPGIS
jgi:golgi phosphoprotein 3